MVKLLKMHLLQYLTKYLCSNYVVSLSDVIGDIILYLVKTIVKDERKYYEDLLKYSREHLMLYPYHLSDVIVKGLRVTPFSYYTNIMADIMSQEKSYDSLPNFTAADCECDFNIFVLIYIYIYIYIYIEIMYLIVIILIV